MVMLDLFAVSKPVIGVLHVPALPGSPLNALHFEDISALILRDAGVLAEAGVDGLILENFGDVPFYPRKTPPHTVAFMTSLCREIKRQMNLPLGINVLRNDSESALAIAAAGPAEFIRVNVHTGARLTDQGLIEGVAHRTLRYRKLLGCDVKIFADVDVKHSAPLALRDLRVEVEEAVSRGCADAVIVTGTATGTPASMGDIVGAKDGAHGVPVLAGSGVNIANVVSVLAHADGVIVGTSLKSDGITANAVDAGRVRDFMKTVQAHRSVR